MEQHVVMATGEVELCEFYDSYAEAHGAYERIRSRFMSEEWEHTAQTINSFECWSEGRYQNARIIRSDISSDENTRQVIEDIRWAFHRYLATHEDEDLVEDNIDLLLTVLGLERR